MARLKATTAAATTQSSNPSPPWLVEQFPRLSAHLASDKTIGKNP